MENNERYIRIYRYTHWYRIWGREGHRQREAFRPSMRWSTANAEFYIMGAEDTGSYDYVDLAISGDSEEIIKEELEAQLSDGAFENSHYGKVELIDSYDRGPYEDRTEDCYVVIDGKHYIDIEEA